MRHIDILDELLGRLQKDEQEVTLPPDTFIYGTINTISFLAKGYFKNVTVEKNSKLYPIHVSQRRDGTYPRIRVEHGSTSHEDISLVI